CLTSWATMQRKRRGNPRELHAAHRASLPLDAITWVHMDQFIERFVAQTVEILGRFDREAIAAMVDGLAAVKRRGGRLFIVGSGGGAGHASHAVNDFRKIVDIEAYAPTDNVSELTARINDDGWDSSYSNWLRASRFRSDDALLVLSVGG